MVRGENTSTLKPTDKQLDQMVKMNASEMLQYRDRVMDIARGNVSPNREICLEWMLYDTLDP